MERDPMGLKQAMEENIRRIKGVLAVSVEENEEGQPEGIFALLDNTKSLVAWRQELDAVVRDLHPNFDLSHLNLAHWDERSVSSGNRPRVERISFETVGDRASVMIGIQWKGNVAWGEATGINSANFVRLLIAQATLQALQKFLKPSFTLTLLGVQEMVMQDRSLIVTCIALSSSFGEQTLTGSAFVRGNPIEVVVKATLDCLNRTWSRIST
jgi:hypothetical protein